jgi:hypothetical protein
MINLCTDLTTRQCVCVKGEERQDRELDEKKDECNGD